MTTRSPALAASSLVPASSPSTRGPHSSRSSETTASERLCSREPATTVCPTLASRAARPRPAGPVAPSTPMFTGAVWHEAPRRPDSRISAAVPPESGDAVGAEEDAELGEEAVAGVDAEVVAELDHGGLVGALEVHEHLAVAGVVAEDLLEPRHPRFAQRTEPGPHAHRRAAVEHDLGPRDLHRDQLRRVLTKVETTLHA